MQRIPTPAGTIISYEKSGSGPPLVLVHGAFSNHRTNWEFVAPRFEEQFTVYAIARRGRGETNVTKGHSIEDEGCDVGAVIQSLGDPVFLLGHSYGALTALAAVLPHVQILELPGQAHEGMTTAPQMYAEAVSRFLLQLSSSEDLLRI